MYNIDNKKFGAFVAQLRKEKGYTQKQLAEKLLLSDKAISKYERGLSFPDIALLEPLSQILDVSISELLHGERKNEHTISVDGIVKETLVKASHEQRKKRSRRITIFFFALLLSGIEVLFILSQNVSSQQLLDDNFITAMVLSILCCAYFFLIAKDQLPLYYDNNKISFVSDGIFRINMPGIHFNNSNWPYVIRIARFWSLLLLIVYPIGYQLMTHQLLAIWETYASIGIIAFLLALFLPLIFVAKKYE